MSFICEGEGCTDRLVTDPAKRYEQRIEFRKVTDQSRYKVILVAHLCKDCVDRLVAVQRPTAQSGSLFA